MKNLSRKQREERGNCVRSAEQEEQRRKHESKALSFAAGKLHCLSCGLFGFLGFLFGFSLRFGVQGKIFFHLDLNPAVLFFYEEEKHQCSRNHND